MAKKKGKKPLEDQISELEAMIQEVESCAACGKKIDPGATTCPHCGTPVREGAALHAVATESLADLEKHLEAAADVPALAPVDPAPPPEPEMTLSSVAEVSETVGSEPDPAPPAPDPMEDAAPAPPAEVEEAPPPEPEEGRDLEGFIAGIEAEVGVPAPEEPAPAPPAPAPRERTLPAQRPRTKSRPPPEPRASSRWVAAVGLGGVAYSFAAVGVAFQLPFLDRLMGALLMVVATLLVVAGINLRSPPRALPAARPPAPVPESDFVCPLCGTGVPRNAAECPTCGAIFEG